MQHLGEDAAAWVYVGFGSNLEPRADYVQRAAHELERRIGSLVRMSGLYETAPVGFTSPHAFLNAAAIYATRLKAADILQHTEAIERSLGRHTKSRPGGAYQDRTIDIDLLLKTDETCSTPRLTLPHPRMAERRFVVEPLAEIAPDLRIGEHTVKELLARMEQRG